MPLFNVDIKPGEKIVSLVEVLGADDSVFDPRTRPSLNDAISMIVGEQNGFAIPFASVALPDHEDLPEQNLFRCLFGRDALLISDLLSCHKPDLLRTVVLALGAVQGVNSDDLSEEEFGRIAHEVRNPDDPRAIEIMKEANWKFPYYGSVDATLIWINSVKKILNSHPHFLDEVVAGINIGERVIRSTVWMLHRLNSPSGFVESRRRNPRGIQNQVWKDSGDSYMHRDGTLARGDSTASIETVAEAFDALIAAADIQELYPSKEWPLSSGELRVEAILLRERLFKTMWLGDRFALGVERNDDGAVVPFDSQASNQARLLDSGILIGDEYAPYREAIAAALVDSGLLCSTGLRTLSAKHVSYRPGGYHTGSAWPMDGVFAARGMLRHGFVSESEKIASRVQKAIESIGGYPEYFRGDYPDHELITRTVADVAPRPESPDKGTNRIFQPPQLIQGWTVGAYAWLTSARSRGNVN